jgi:hypothetical protein
MLLGLLLSGGGVSGLVIQVDVSEQLVLRLQDVDDA